MNHWSQEAEQSVLGALMLSEQAWDAIAGTVRAQDFYLAEHQAIFRACEAIATAGKPIDPVTVADVAGKELTPLLAELVRNCPGWRNVEAYAKIVAERSLYRRVLTAHREGAEILQGESGTITGRAHLAVNLVTDALDHAVDELPNLKDQARAWVDRLEHRFTNGDEITGLRTGLRDLDRATSGLQPGEVTVIAARPSMGKSALALQIIEHVCREGRSAYVASLEMPSLSLIDRLCACSYRLPYKAVRSAKFGDDEWAKITAFTARMSTWRLQIDDRSRLDMAALEASLRRHKRKFGLDVAVLDYLQLLDMPGDNRNNAVAAASRGLKVLAGELGIPIIVLSQLNRDLERRADKRPMMADLRDSGAIEQDAHTILFLYRDVVYNPQTPLPNITELIVGKARDSERGVIIPLESRLDMMRFDDVDWATLPQDWRA